jgi:hypothetical protein
MHSLKLTSLQSITHTNALAHIAVWRCHTCIQDGTGSSLLVIGNEIRSIGCDMYNFGLLSADVTLLYADRRHRIVITSAFDMTAVRSCMPVFCCFTLLSRLYLFTRLCIFAKMTHFRQHFVQLYHRDKLAY